MQGELKVLIKITRICALLVLIGTICGCSSMVSSTREITLPDTAAPLAGVRYYLPKGAVQVSASWDNLIPGWQPRCTILTEADPYYCYRLRYKGNVLFDDDVTVAVDPGSGLLTGINALTTDQSINSVGNLVAAAGTALTFGASLGPVSSYGARGNNNEEFKEIRDNAYTSSFQISIEPDQTVPPIYLVSPDESSPKLSQDTNGAPVKAENNKVTPLYAKFEITLTRIITEPPQTASEMGSNVTKLDGIVVRMPVPFTLEIKGTFYKPQDSYNTPRYADSKFTVLLPDEQHNYFLPISRRPLVMTGTKVVLNNGMIESYQQIKPSIVAGIVGIPKTILNALVPIPLEIRQSQANNVEAVQSTLNGQAAIQKLQK